MEKKIRVNIVSGIIHDLRNPCWWTMKTNKDSVIDFYTIEEAEAELANRSIVPHKCEHCKRKSGDIK